MSARERMPVGERCVWCGGAGWLGVVGGPDLEYARGECSRCGGTGRQRRGWLDRALERLGAWLDARSARKGGGS